MSNTQTVPGVVSTSASGLAPTLPNNGTTVKFLREDATWAEPSITTINGYTVESSVPSDAVFTDTTYNVVTSSAAGLVPALPTTAGTTKFLREDATWVEPNYVNKSGDTMTGMLYIDSTDLTDGVAPDSSTFGRGIRFRDS